jgi:cytochrome c oxidase subunit 2
MALRFQNRRTVFRFLAAAAVAPALDAVLFVRAQPVQPAPRVIEVVAKKFEFVPELIHVALGETVILQFTAPEVPMGFSLADFNLRTDIVPGKPASVRITADKAGTFMFVCDTFCGSGHEDMSGALIVDASKR